MIVRNFEYLLALYREGHYGNAARICNVSQPTLSSGIRQLEKDMGVEIVRHGRRYDGLTLEGYRVLALAQKMSDDCRTLDRELAALRSGFEGELRLGIVPGTTSISPILSAALAEKFPLLQQTISTASPCSLLQGIKSNGLDVALMHLENTCMEDFDTRVLHKERLFLFGCFGLELPASVTWEDVLSRQLCLLASTFSVAVESRLEQSKMRSVVTDSVSVLVSHISTGRFFAVLPQSLANNFLHVANVRAVVITGTPSHCTIALVAGKNSFESASVRAFLEVASSPELAIPVRAIMSIHRRLRAKD